MLLLSVFSVPCPSCGEVAINRVAALRPPVECSQCGTLAQRAEHPLADAVELLGPPFFIVSLLLSLFNWSVWPTVVVAGLWLLASARIPLVPAPTESEGRDEP